MVVLVSGAAGQLGQAIKSRAEFFSDFNFVFCTSAELNITNLENCKAVFAKYQPAFCINTAAYTAVDKAESEPELAEAINVLGAENLAKASKEHNTVLLHVSTDFVFDGSAKTPYKETDAPNPQSVYGATKLKGEQAIASNWEKHFIVRTSWVFSEFGNNFKKTMLRLASDRDELSVVADQIGTPTQALDLANVLLQMCDLQVKHTPKNYGIYHFSNLGECSWFDFAKEIFKQNNVTIKLNPIHTSAYPTPVKRPAYSVMDKTKIQQVFGVEIKSWENVIVNKD